MNVRRGLFRLWVVGAFVWAAIVTTFFWGEIEEPWLPYHNYVYLDDEFFKFDDDGVRYAPSAGFRLVDFPRHVVLHVLGSMTNNQIAELVPRFKKHAVEVRDSEVVTARWNIIPTTCLIAFGPSVIVLILGTALAWAFAGFRKERAGTGA